MEEQALHRYTSRLRLDGVILACAVSAGIHAALVPEHLHEGDAPAAGFAASALVLGAIAVALTRKPQSRTAAVAAAAVFAGLIASYALAVTTGVPLLHPERESLDTLALCTKAIEVLGLVLALALLQPNRTGLSPNRKEHRCLLEPHVPSRSS